MRLNKRWSSLAIVIPVLVGVAWLAAGRRPTPPSPAALPAAPESAHVPALLPLPERAPEPIAPPVLVQAALPAPAFAEPVAVEIDDPITEDSVPADVEAKIKTYYPQPSRAAEDERDRTVGELVASGPGGAQWLDQFRNLEHHWLELDNQNGFGIELSDWECFKNGCTVTMRVPSVEALQHFSQLVRDGRTTQEWRGAGFRSGPIQTDTGEIEATWIFYAPSAG